jgi:hypothetical protein
MGMTVGAAVGATDVAPAGRNCMLLLMLLWLLLLIISMPRVSQQLLSKTDVKFLVVCTGTKSGRCHDAEAMSPGNPEPAHTGCTPIAVTAGDGKVSTRDRTVPARSLCCAKYGRTLFDGEGDMPIAISLPRPPMVEGVATACDGIGVKGSRKSSDSGFIFGGAVIGVFGRPVLVVVVFTGDLQWMNVCFTSRAHVSSPRAGSFSVRGELGCSGTVGDCTEGVTEGFPEIGVVILWLVFKGV